MYAWYGMYMYAPLIPAGTIRKMQEKTGDQPTLWSATATKREVFRVF